jgi:predicted RND superfamily exporter protein
VVVVFLSFWGFSKGPQLPINLSLSKLLPEHNPSVKEMDDVSEDVGGVGHLMLLIGPIDEPESYLGPLSKSIEKEVEDIKYLFFEKERYQMKNRMLYLLDKKEFRKLRKNARILFKKGESGFINLGLEDEEQKKKNLASAKQYFRDFKKDNEVKQYFLSKKKNYVMMMIKPTFESVDLKRSSKLLDSVHGVVKKYYPNLPYHLIGRHAEKVHDTKQMQSDIGRTGLISAIGIVLVLFLGMGSLRGALLVMSGVILSMGWTVGIAYYLVGQINILTGFLLAILAGLGTDYGIHLFRRFHEEINSGKERYEAIRESYHKTGRALFSAALTTVIAFFVLYFSEFRGFSELGVIAGFGVLSIFIVFMGTFPVVGGLLPTKLYLSRVRTIFSFYPYGPKIARILVFILPIALWGALNAEFEYDFNRMRDLSAKTDFLNNLSSELYGKPTSPSAILASSKKEATEIKNWLLEDQFNKEVNDVISLSSALPDKMKSRYRKVKKLKKLIDGSTDKEIKEKTGIKAEDIREWLQGKPYTRDDLPININESFGKSGNIVLIYPGLAQNTKDNIYAFGGLLRKLKKKFPNAKIGSDTLVFMEILDHIIEDGKYIILLFLFGTFITFLIDLRSFKAAALLEGQLIFGILFMMGLMGLSGVRFTIMNVGMFPAILAIGIDMAVHVRHREDEGYSSTKGAGLSASAVHLSLMTTLIGFGSLFFAEAKMLLGIAWISVLGQVGMYLICMVFFPAVRDLISNRGGNTQKSSQEI